ncbi:MAG: ATP-binding protein [Dissulfurimicrobium sp.]|uniref:ATP-binding protein n=1 Tax=Dissulfurimicrobium sp. TaxID=2022436 RepID=UPI0040493547
MKICICGKGGSGKSTVVALLTHGFISVGKKVIVLDSDESNTSLFWMLGFDKPPQSLMDFLGGKKKIQQKMIARFTKGEDEPAMSIWDMETIQSQSMPTGYAVEKDGVMLISTGKIQQAMEGCACPMGSVSREFLKKFQTGANEVLLADMEAGIEHFGRGLEAGVDGVVGVVEPSLESILLTKKMMELARSAGTTFYGAILNKMASIEQENQVIGRLNDAGVPFIGSIGFQETLQAACLAGKPLADVAQSMNLKGLVEVLLQKQEGKQTT